MVLDEIDNCIMLMTSFFFVVLKSSWPILYSCQVSLPNGRVKLGGGGLFASYRPLSRNTVKNRVKDKLHLLFICCSVVSHWPES